MVQVTIEEAKSQLQELIQKGETVVITQDGEQVAQLVPVGKINKGRQPGTAEGLIWMSEDFDSSLEDFKDY